MPRRISPRSILAALALALLCAACSGGGGGASAIPASVGAALVPGGSSVGSPGPSAVAPAPAPSPLPSPGGGSQPTFATAPAAPPNAPTASPSPSATTPDAKSGAAVAPAQTQPFANGPFDRPVVLPQIDANASASVANVLGNERSQLGKLQFATNATGPTDSDVPIYVAHASDPVYTIHCRYYSNCPLEGVRERIPRGAVPGGRLGYATFTDDGTHDQHLAVRDLDAQVEYDTWLTPQPNGSGGTLEVGYGGAFPLGSGGYGEPGGATAAGFALSQGRIRAVDLLAGRIPYAIFLVTPCENGHVAPATGDDGGTTAGCPPLGAHVWLDSSPAEIAASGAAPDFQVILAAMHEFGGYIGDRCSSCTLGVALEGGAAYTAFNEPNPWTQIAAHFPNEAPSGPASEYHIVVSSGTIDLSKHLHVISN